MSSFLPGAPRRALDVASIAARAGPEIVASADAAAAIFTKSRRVVAMVRSPLGAVVCGAAVDSLSVYQRVDCWFRADNRRAKCLRSARALRGLPRRPDERAAFRAPVRREFVEGIAALGTARLFDPR